MKIHLKQLFFLAATFLWYGLTAQDFQIDMDGGISPPAHPIGSVFTSDLGFTYSIGAQDMTGNVQYFEDTDIPLDPASGLSLSIPAGFVDPTNPSGHVVLTAPGPLVTGSYNFVIQAQDQGANEVFQEFTITIQRSPISVVLVLDRSGSMGSAPNGGGNTSRMEILKTAAELFINKLDEFSIADDEIALTYFESTVDTPPASFGSTLTPITGNALSLTNDVDNQTPGTATAMGDGLIAGKNKLPFPTVGKKQFIFLFTDGIQNVGNLVTDDGTHAGANSLNNTDNSIQIFVLGTGGAAIGDTANRLQAIADANRAGGVARYFLLQEEVDVNAPAVAISNFFDEIFQSMLSNSSPQTIGVVEGVMQPQLPETKNFEINANINKILFELITTDREPIFNIEKDGVPVNESNSSFKLINGTNSLLAIVNLEGSSLTSQGTWKVNIQSGTGGGKPYQMKAQVDDHRLDYTFEVHATNFKVEDTLKIDATLSYDNIAIEDATISALVLKPGEDLGDLLARANVKYELPNYEDNISVGYQKLLALIAQNPTLIDSLNLQENVIPLVHTQDGKYEAQFSNTDVTGVYQIIGQISGSNASVGTYNRIIRRTAYLRFGDPDPELSTQQYNQINNNSAQLIYTPMFSVNGVPRFVGPGFGGGINITGTDISNVTTIDNGDGSYTINFDLLNGNTNPEIKINLSGVTVYEGKASDFSQSKSFIDKLFDWLQNTFGIPAWLAILLLLLILLIIIWLIKKFKN